MENLELYNSLRAVPETAKKTITAGRLKGKTDINPMWRIEKLTETFGPVGFGWYYTIDKQWIEPSPETKELAAFCDITLYVKYGGEWSKGIEGTGGSTFVAKETNGLYCSDEAYKMALTDALSVSCKALGVAADVYWDKTETKYAKAEAPKKPTEAQIKKLELLGVVDKQGKANLQGIANWCHKTLAELTAADVEKAIAEKIKEKAAEKAGADNE